MKQANISRPAVCGVWGPHQIASLNEVLAR